MADDPVRTTLTSSNSLRFPANQTWAKQFDQAGGRVVRQATGHLVFYRSDGRRILATDSEGHPLHECEWGRDARGRTVLSRARLKLDWGRWVGVKPGGLVNETRLNLATKPGWQRLKAEDLRHMAAQAMRVPPGGAVNYVADWVMDVLNDLVGRVDQDVVIETSIDPVLQASAERALTEELAKNGDKQHVGQGAVVSMTPDGAVRALVGGRDYAASQFNRAVAAKRQPGSAFKPFVYLTALERGLTPDTVREDRPISLKNWHPENYSREYFGPVTLKQALAMSLNTVSVRLVLEFGAPAVVRTAHRLGISSKLEANPSIALGTSEVSVLELVSAFAPFANGGNAITPHIVERVRGRADGQSRLLQ